MIAYRLVLSAAFIVLGAIVIARMAPFGLSLSTLPGFAFGLALAGLGFYRITLAIRLYRDRP
ncbi:MAG: hypothetical protein ACYDA5_08625 [Vulcanimicrobiaceae bacterium]